MPEVQARLRDARDRLSQSDYEVGYFYYRQRWYPGAVDRFKALLKQDPEFTNRDAVYFYLAEALVKANQKAEALPYFERLVAGISAERVPARREQADRGAEGASQILRRY